VSSDFRSVAHLLPLASCQDALEILDALAEKPHTFAELRAHLPFRTRRLCRALRILATENAILRLHEAGTWDHRPVAHTRYELTTSGHQLVHELNDLDVWITIYERYLYGPAGS
jgi:DNA-binding HxlR family transcriptional regulator